MSSAAAGRSDHESLMEHERDLLREVGDLRAALEAIRRGGIDAVVLPGPQGENLYTLTSADRPYRVLVEEMGEGAATLSEHGIVLYANKRFADLLGRDRADLLGRDLTDLVPAQDPEVMDDLLATGPGRTTHMELTLVHADGSTTPVLASATGLDLEGSVVRCLIIADLTRRVEAEELFRLTMENATIGMSLESPEGRFTLVNPALCRMLGRDAETLMKTTWQDVTHPDDLAVDEGLFDDLKAGRIPSFRVRKRYLRPDGSVFWGDLWMSTVRNDDGSLQSLIGQVVDVNEQVQATEKLAESEKQYRLLAENASDVVMRLDPGRRFEWMSGSVADVLGWAAPDLVDQVVDEFIHPDDLPQFRQLINGVGPGSGVRVECRFRRSDDTYRWVDYRARAKVGEDGTPQSLVVGLVDIEARKVAEAKELDRLYELERFQQLTVGRELKMIVLKREIEHLKSSISADRRDSANPLET